MGMRTFHPKGLKVEPLRDFRSFLEAFSAPPAGRTGRKKKPSGKR